MYIVYPLDIEHVTIYPYSHGGGKIIHSELQTYMSVIYLQNCISFSLMRGVHNNGT